jgi:hypothetical protein
VRKEKEVKENSETCYEGLALRLIADSNTKGQRTRLTFCAPSFPYIMRLSVLSDSIYAEHTVRVVSNAEVKYLSSHTESHEGLGL